MPTVLRQGPYRLQRRVSRTEIARVLSMVAQNQPELLEAWNEYFNG